MSKQNLAAKEIKNKKENNFTHLVSTTANNFTGKTLIVQKLQLKLRKRRPVTVNNLIARLFYQ